MNEKKPTVYKAIHRVRSYELDSFGHVNNAVFLNYLEYARGDFLMQRDFSFSDFYRWNALPFVIRAEIDYKSPAVVHDELEISGFISKWRRTSFCLDYKIFNKTSQRVSALAKMTLAFVDQDNKLVAIPREFREKMA